MKPKISDTLLEVPRYLHSLLWLGLTHPWTSDQSGEHPHPVMVLPGFAAGNGTTALLRKYIGHWGHSVVDWELGTNINPREMKRFDDFLAARDQSLDRLASQLEQHHRESGEPVTLVGWSLGGLMAKMLANRLPGSIRQVITLGSPNGDPRLVSAYRVMEKIGNQPMTDRQAEQWMEMCEVPLHDTPLTVIYSRRDGLVHPAIATQPEHAKLQNIGLYSSHLGLIVNPLAYHVIADRLSQPRHSWEHFRPPRLLQRFFEPGEHQPGNVRRRFPAH